MPKPATVPGRENPPQEAERKPPTGLSVASLESVPRKTRRRFSAPEKLRLVKAADAAIASGERGALESLLRREGIYGSHLRAWRQQLGARGAAGLAPQKPGRKPKLDESARQVLALTKKNVGLERKLKLANALIELQKKAHEILGLTLPELDESI